MYEGLIKRKTSLRSTGHVTLVGDISKALTSQDSLPCDLSVVHVQLVDLEDFAGANEYFKRSYRLIDRIPRGLVDDDVVLRSSTSQELVSDACKYVSGRFDEIPDRVLARKLGLEPDLPILERYREVTRSSSYPLSSEVLGEYVRDAQEIKSTLYCLEPNSDFDLEYLSDKALDEHVFSLENRLFGLSFASARDLQKNAFSDRFLSVDNHSYFTAGLVRKFAELDKLRQQGLRSDDEFVESIHNVYLHSALSVEDVSLAAEMVFQESLSDVNDYLFSRRQAEWLGDTDRSKTLKKEISARLLERL